MLQWWHLDRLLKHKRFRHQLEKYDVIIKLRADLIFHAPLTHAGLEDIPNGCFQMNSDHSFYARRATFFEALDDFYATLMTKYAYQAETYFDLNWENLKQSCNNTLPPSKMPVADRYELSRYRHIRRDIQVPLQWLVYPVSIYDRNVQTLAANIQTISGKPDMSQGITNKGMGNTVFSSEKFFLLHVINKFPVCRNKLPVIGVSQRRSDLSFASKRSACKKNEN